MINCSDTDRVLEAMERMRREAYAAGWRDAMAAVNKAASELSPPELIPELLSNVGVADLPPSSGTATANATGVTMGSTPWYVLQAVRKKAGMTGSEVVSVVQEGGHRVSEANIRTALNRLAKKKLIVGRHRKWFPA